MLNDLIPNRKYNEIVYFGFGLLAIYLIRLGLNFFVTYKGHTMGTMMQADMRSMLFEHLQELPYSFYDTHETGKIMTRITDDLFEITELAHHGPENIIISSLTLILSLIYLLTINVPLSLLLALIVPILVVVSSNIRKIHLENRRRTRTATGRINGNVQTSISGIRTTKAFTNKDKEIEKFEVENDEYIQANKEGYLTMAKYHSVSNFITDIFNVVILIAGGLLMYDGKINFADYSAFVVATASFISPIKQLINFTEQLQSGITGFERFCEIMDTPAEEDPEDAIELNDVKGRIELENVSYGYDEDEGEVLKNVSLIIKEGQTLALVGPSGGGKTTICHLIPHFYEVENGRILVDGHDINHVTRKSLRKNIGIVQQDSFLFNASIRDNILYGKLDATEEEMIQAAKNAYIHDFVMTLPDGYDTVVGERGVRLSGGQKQRICIARIFLKNPSILILDEATSALDNTTEFIIQQALNDLCKDRTTIVVAHRLSTIKNADEICVIDDGVIKEKGTHQQLLQQNGMYAELYNQQFKLNS